MKATTAHVAIFESHVDEWVTLAIREGAGDFDSLVRALPGVYPVQVIESLDRLAVRGSITESARDAILSKKPTNIHVHGSRCISKLPVPHPLDYDWRFSDEAVDKILGICCQYGEHLVCMGTPTVFLKSGKFLRADKVVLLDKNPAVIQHIAESMRGSQVHRLDLLVDPIPDIQSDVVVTDPPWYPEYMAAFVWAASQICRHRGHLLISLPPRGTRPTVNAEVAQVLAFATALGFCVRQVRDDYLPYETPPFESNALSAVGCRLCGGPWRRGTLCVLQKLEHSRVRRPRFDTSVANWTEANLHGTRFRFRHKRLVGFDDPSLIPLVEGDILRTVSRREPLRKCVDIWSSGNRVFRCLAPAILWRIADSLAAGENPTDLVRASTTISLNRWSKRLVQYAAEQIEGLALTEHFERRFFGKG
jgi:hypothetical protein